MLLLIIAMAINKKKIFYTMGEVCEMFDLPASTVRFWTNKIPALKTKKNAKGNRIFTLDNIETFKVLYNLIKERGMTIAGAQQYLANSKSIKEEVSIIEMLQDVKASLLDIRNELDTIIGKKEEIVIKTYEEDVQEAERNRYFEPTIFDIF